MSEQSIEANQQAEPPLVVNTRSGKTFEIDMNPPATGDLDERIRGYFDGLDGIENPGDALAYAEGKSLRTRVDALNYELRRVLVELVNVNNRFDQFKEDIGFIETWFRNRAEKLSELALQKIAEKQMSTNEADRAFIQQAVQQAAEEVFQSDQSKEFGRAVCQAVLSRIQPHALKK